MCCTTIRLLFEVTKNVKRSDHISNALSTLIRHMPMPFMKGHDLKLIDLPYIDKHCELLSNPDI